MKEKIENYIICNSCKVGGYDYCPECLGAGGYTINLASYSNLSFGNCNQHE